MHMHVHEGRLELNSPLNIMKKNKFSQAEMAHLADKIGSRNQRDQFRITGLLDKYFKCSDRKSGSPNYAVMLGGRQVSEPLKWDLKFCADGCH